MNNKFKKTDVCVLCFSSDNKNYGANLVCYAMNKIVNKLGYSASILNFYKKNKENKEKTFSKFRNNFLNLTCPVRYFYQFYMLNFFYNVFITGSDQVFNTLNTKPYEKRYFLDFVQSRKGKIAFSASFGLEQFIGSKKLIQEVKKLLERFDYISVREESAVGILQETFNSTYNSKVTIDPTLMLEEKDYIDIMENINPEFNSNYIAYYILSLDYGIKTKETISGLNKVSAQLQLPLFNLLYDMDKKSYTIGLWLNYIKKAKYIITDSFHGICFSIIFRKNFVYISRLGSGRIRNLLNLVDLDYLIYNNFENISFRDIDYNKVYNKLQKLKDYSFQYLDEAIYNTISKKK